MGRGVWQATRDAPAARAGNADAQRGGRLRQPPVPGPATEMSLLPAALYRSAQVRELDRRAIEQHGIPAFTLMQRAAAAVHKEIRWRWPEARRVTVVCGPGNNGGDGFLVAVLARESGYEVRALLVGSAGVRQGAAAEAWAALGRAGVQAAAFNPEALDKSEIIVDAMLGIGLTRAVEGRMRAAIDAINERRRLGARVLAVDIPTGLDA